MGNSPLQTVYTGDSIVVAAATMVHGFQIARTSPKAKVNLHPQVIDSLSTMNIQVFLS